MARLSKAERAALEEAKENLNLKPGKIVLIKNAEIKAWPGMAVDEADIPKDVTKSKPSVPAPICLYLLIENRFVWVSVSDVSDLPTEQALKLSKNSRTRKALKEAYYLASTEPSYQDVINPPTPPSEPEEREPEEQEPEEQEPEEQEPEEQEPEEPQQEEPQPVEPEEKSPKKQTKTNKKSQTKSQQPPRKKQKIEEVEDVEVDDEESSEYVEPSGTEESEYNDTDSFKQSNLKSDQESRVKFCTQLRKQVQTAYLVPESEKSDISEQVIADLTKLNQLENLETAVVRRTKLAKVLKLTSENCDLEPGFKSKIDEFVERFNPGYEPIIDGIPEELAPKEEPQEGPEEVAQEEVDGGNDEKSQNDLQSEPHNDLQSTTPTSEGDLKASNELGEQSKSDLMNADNDQVSKDSPPSEELKKEESN